MSLILLTIKLLLIKWCTLKYFIGNYYEHWSSTFKENFVFQNELHKYSLYKLKHDIKQIKFQFLYIISANSYKIKSKGKNILVKCHINIYLIIVASF